MSGGLEGRVRRLGPFEVIDGVEGVVSLLEVSGHRRRRGELIAVEDQGGWKDGTGPDSQVDVDELVGPSEIPGIGVPELVRTLTRRDPRRRRLPKHGTVQQRPYRLEEDGVGRFRITLDELGGEEGGESVADEDELVGLTDPASVLPRFDELGELGEDVYVDERLGVEA